MKTKAIFIFFLGCLFMAYFGFWASMAVLTGLWLVSKAVQAVFSYIWAVLTWSGRLLDNPLFLNPVFQFDVSNFVKKYYDRIITKNHA